MKSTHLRMVLCAFCKLTVTLKNSNKAIELKKSLFFSHKKRKFHHCCSLMCLVDFYLKRYLFLQVQYSFVFYLLITTIFAYFFPIYIFTSVSKRAHPPIMIAQSTNAAFLPAKSHHNTQYTFIITFRFVIPLSLKSIPLIGFASFALKVIVCIFSFIISFKFSSFILSPLLDSVVLTPSLCLFSR